jgi:hypothetical protein
MANKWKYIKKPRSEETEDILKEWFQIARASSSPVSGVILLENAMHIAKRLQIETAQDYFRRL